MPARFSNSILSDQRGITASKFIIILVILTIGIGPFFLNFLYQHPDLFSYELIDTDNDGISDFDEEIIHGSDRSRVDSDSDGLTDTEEINEYDTDPGHEDSDRDGLSDSDEITINGTDPLHEDSDGDGLGDYKELTTHATDPNRGDSDRDELNDYEELTTHGTDPLHRDTDRDGLDDNIEVTHQTPDSWEDDYEYVVTDPTSADTDGDTVTDYDEIGVYETDPNRVDTDGDGYSDYYMVTTVSNLTVPTERFHFTNPLDSTAFHGRDADGDGFPDHMERANGNLSVETKDVIVKVNWVEGYAPRTGGLLNIRDEFANSPVDDDAGIRLHFYIAGPVTVPETITQRNLEDLQDQVGRNDDGMHSAVYVRTVMRNGVPLGGMASGVNPLFAVAASDRPHDVGTTTMHELGHSLGLRSHTYAGIDSRSKSETEYPSVMNYDTSCFIFDDNCYMYSSGAGYNDWATIERLLEAGSTTPTDS